MESQHDQGVAGATLIDAVGSPPELDVSDGTAATPSGGTDPFTGLKTVQLSPRVVDEQSLVHLATRLTRRQPSRYERLGKPVIDRLIAFVFLAVALPLLAAIHGAVLLAIGRPALFRQARMGRNGRVFDMLKFRTMRPDRRKGCADYTGPERRLTHKSASDPRHTRVGRWMRKTSLDELPQLFHVLRGQMSLVGPRPELVSLVKTYAPWQHSRHLVKPGVTGLWQTTERGEGRMLHECVDLDLKYISELSFLGDLAILLRTPMALLRNKGVI